MALGYLLAFGDINCLSAALHSEHFPALLPEPFLSFPFPSLGNSCCAEGSGLLSRGCVCRDYLLEFLRGQVTRELIAEGGTGGLENTPILFCTL